MTLRDGVPERTEATAFAEELVEEAPCGFLVTDARGQIIYANRKVRTWTGLDGDTICTRRFTDLLNPAGRFYHETQISPMLRLQGFAREILCRIERPDDDPLPVLMSAVFRQEADDGQGRIDITLFDATERTLYEANLRAARDDAEELAAIVRTAAVGIARADHEGRIKRWNAAAEKTFDILEKDAVGQLIHEILPLNDRPDWFLEKMHSEEIAKGNTRFRADLGDKHLDITMARVVGPDTEPGREDYSLVLRDVTRQVTNERRLQIAMREMNHRVKNLLAVVGAIARQTFRRPETREERDKFHSRLMALSRANDLLTGAGLQNSSLRDVVNLTARESGEEESIDVEGPEIRLASNEVSLVSMALHELLTNSLKHGALSVAEGRVSIRWTVDDEADRFVLVWSETGGPQVEPPTRKGFGSKMLGSLVPGEMRGRAELRYDVQGVVYTLDCPLPERVRAADMRAPD